ncbi:MAG: histidine ammonia-lyase, partial [Croceitalea sp.]|nr:histidine ammonia-lyase [Croceitalea sp.]
MSSNSSSFLYGEHHLSPSLALALMRGKVVGSLSKKTKAKINKSSNIVANIVAKGEPVYGI